MIKEVSAGCFVLNDKNEVLLIRRIWPSGEDTYAAPKGHQDPGEDIETTAVRETTEETGYTDIEIIKELEPETYSPKEGYMKTVHWYLAKLLSNSKEELHLTKEEQDSEILVEWMSIEEALNKISFPIQKLNLEKILEYIDGEF